MGANVKYKDSVFSLLFSDKDILRELYCALDNVSLPPDIPISINTLKDVLIKDRENDLSFEIGGKIVVLIEHQSTINPNMALRMLIYIAHIYGILTKGGDIYGTKKILIPAPEFFVFYNGEKDCPDEYILRLSDCFENPADLLMVPTPWRQGSIQDAVLELKVRVININEGRSAELAGKCETLAGYGIFVGKVRENRKAGMKLRKAIKKAVEYCLEHDILKKFLKKHAKEVIKMLKRKWRMKDALAWRYKEGREEGHEERSEEIARNALMKGFSIDVIHEITGLDTDKIRSLQLVIHNA